LSFVIVFDTVLKTVSHIPCSNFTDI